MSGFVINVPSDEAELREEVEEQLSRYARVSEAPKKFGGNEIQLIVDVVMQGTTLAANLAAIATFLLLLKDRYAKTGTPSGISIARFGGEKIPLEQVDERVLRRVIGAEEKDEG